MIEKLSLIVSLWFATGAALLGAMLAFASLRRTAAEILRTMVSAITIAVLVLAAFYAAAYRDGAGLMLALVAVAARVGWEAAVVLGLHARRAGALLALAAALAGFADWPGKAVQLPLVLAGAWLLTALVGAGPGYRRHLQWLFFPALPLLLLVQACTSEWGRHLVLFAFLITEAFDSLALVTGKLVGRTPLAPSISPNKTWEGLAGGVVLTTLVVVLATVYLQLDIGHAVVATVVAIACAIVGDLSGSKMKRRAGVKDFPLVHARQGGLLDAFDAWIVAGAVLGTAAIGLPAA